MTTATTLRGVRATYATLAPYGRPYRRQFVGGAVATLVLVASRLAFPWPLRGLMEIVFRKGSHGRGRAVVALVPHHLGDPLWWLVGAFVAIVLLWGVSESLQRLAFMRFAAGLVRDSRDAALVRLPAMAAERDAGDLIAAVTGDAARVKSGVKGVLIGTSRNAAFFVGATVIIGLIDWTIALVFLAGGVATVLASAAGAWRSSPIARRSRGREGGLTGELHRFLAGEAALAVVGDGAGTPKAKVARIEGQTTFAVHVVLAASTCGILVLAIDAGRSGRLSPGSVFTILAYVLLMHNKTVGFGRRVVRAGRLLASAERLAALLQPPDPDAGAPGRDVSDPAPDPVSVDGLALSFLVWPR